MTANNTPEQYDVIISGIDALLALETRAAIIRDLQAAREQVLFTAALERRGQTDRAKDHASQAHAYLQHAAAAMKEVA